MSAATVPLKSLYWTPALKVSIPFPRSAISREPISLRSYLMLRAVIRRLKQPRAYKSALSAAGSRKSKGRKRSEDRRVGKECVSTCRSRQTPYHYKNNKRPTENKNIQ